MVYLYANLPRRTQRCVKVAMSLVSLSVPVYDPFSLLARSSVNAVENALDHSQHIP